MNTIFYTGNKENILGKILSADYVVSDFDGTDVKSPLKKAAIDYCSNISNIVSRPKLLPWAVKAGLLRYVIEGKDSESRLWSEFSEILGEDIHPMIESLRDCLGCKDDMNGKNAFLGSKVKSLDSYFLPGVKDFYKLLDNSELFYASRNFTDIIGIFADELDVPIYNIYSELPSKGVALEKIIQRNDLMDKAGGIYVLRGDSNSDDEVIDVAKFYKEKDVIDDFVAIAIDGCSHSYNPDVSVVVSSNQTPLVNDLIKYQKSQ